jgi:hypothetical protein
MEFTTTANYREVSMANHPRALSQWGAEVSTSLPHLSKPQAMGLALYSLGMMVVQCSGISSIACFLGELLGQKENTVRQRLREVTYEAKAKRGDQRRTLDVRQCFAPLLRWIVRWWDDEEQRIALALDASTLGQRFTVLVISVMYRGCALPVAWVVLPATKKGAWMPHWKRLLRDLRGVLPEAWLVIVLADQGLYSKTLYRAIQRNGWHPMMRITGQGLYRPTGQQRFRPLGTLLPYPKTVWYGHVDCFVTTSARLPCTLLAHWDAGFDKPWLLLTDLAPNTANALWYAMRMWIEHGFKDCKRGGFRWEQTKMTDPERATRLWLVIALATLRAVSVGGAVDHLIQSASGLTGDLPPAQTTRPRRLSVFKRGLFTILAHLIRFASLPLGRFCPEPWPRLPFARVVCEPFWQGGHFVLY